MSSFFSSVRFSRADKDVVEAERAEEVRRNRFKVVVDAEEGRRRREDNMVAIRKNKREDSLQKKGAEISLPDLPVARAEETGGGIMSDEEHHFESKGDLGASKTYPQQARTIRKNNYIVIKGRPCKVMRFAVVGS